MFDDAKHERARARAAASRERARDRRDAEWKAGARPAPLSPATKIPDPSPPPREEAAMPPLRLDASGKLTLDDVIGQPRDSYWVDDHGDRDPSHKYSTTDAPYVQPPAIL